MHDRFQPLVEWQPPRRSSAPCWISGLSLTEQAPLEQILRDLPQPVIGKVLFIPFVWAGYCSYASLECLMRELWPLILREAPELIMQFQVEKIFPALDSTRKRPGRRSLADAIVFAIIRRISRESLHSALLIDRLARFLLMAKRTCPSLRGPVVLVTSGLEYWDRPSIRVLYRLCSLSEPSDQLRWVAFLNSRLSSEQEETDPPLPKRLERARAKFLKTVETEGGIKRYSYEQAEPFSLPSLPPEGESEISIETVAEALADQNYERVYLLCQGLLEQNVSSEELSQVWRMIALADANVKAYEDSMKALEHALSLATVPTFRAHLRYLQGLLNTKRFYDLSVAEDFYTRGETELTSCDSDRGEVRLEKAWLLNGRALVRSLQAKESQGNQREKLLWESLHMELRAYKLVANDEGAAFSYLRYNLLSNITFLLEITQRFREAIDFWQRAFESHMAVGNPQFELAFKGRLGLLKSRCGDVEEAVNLLTEAYYLAEKIADPYCQERLNYGLAYICYSANRLGEASDWFCKGLRLAAEQRLWRNFAEHLVGALYCAVRMQDCDAFMMLLRKGAQLPVQPLYLSCQGLLVRDYDSCPSLEELQKAGFRLPVPSPKLPAYIPDLDLEGSPEYDLNRVLVEPGQQRLVRVNL